MPEALEIRHPRDDEVDELYRFFSSLSAAGEDVSPP